VLGRGERDGQRRGRVVCSGSCVVVTARRRRVLVMVLVVAADGGMVVVVVVVVVMGVGQDGQASMKRSVVLDGIIGGGLAVW
jgi:hypothetical protein